MAASQALKSIPTTDPAVLKAQARYMSLMEDVYLRELSPSERYVAMTRYVRSHRQLLKDKFETDDLDELCKKVYDHVVNMQPDGLVKVGAGVLKRRPGRPTTAEKAARDALNGAVELLEVKKEQREADAPFDDDEETGTRIYHDGGDYPPDEPNRFKRDGVTISGINELHKPPDLPVEDLVGDRPPRTLIDLYARWPITTSKDYLVRIERTAPKKYNSLDVTGLVAEVRGRKITEADIQQMFGGREYKILLYGPDPRRRVDGEGNVVIKPLTEPITLTVPYVPPVIRMPVIDSMGDATGVNQESVGANMNMMNPFGMVSAPVTPTTPADSAIHKTNVGFFADIFKLTQLQSEQREKMSDKNTGALLNFVSESQKNQLKAVEQQAKTTIEKLEDEVKELRKLLKEEGSNTSKVAAEVAKAKDASNTTILELVTKMGPDKEAEIRRLADNYQTQLNTIRQSHDDQMKQMRQAHDDQIKTLRDRHESDLRRSDERLKDSEASYRQILENERSQFRALLENERSQWTKREADLRTQNDKQLDAERSMMNQRIQDMKERNEAELRQLTAAHEREMRTLKEAQGMKETVKEETHKMTLTMAQQREKTLEQQMEELKAELEDAKDLTTQLERAEKQASLLGYTKADAHEPKGPWERLAATAGSGISQLFANANEWLPNVMAQRAEAQARAAAAAQPQAARRLQQPPQEAQQRPQRVRRVQPVEWEGGRPPQAPTPAPREPLGFVQNPAPAPVVAQPVAQPVATPSTPPPPPEESNAVSNGHAGESEVDNMFPPKFMQHFPIEALIGFLSQSERHINGGTPASIFAEQMVMQFAEGAQTLTTHFTASEVTDAVAALPGSEMSPLVRRDGKKWMERLFVELRKYLAARGPQAESPVTH